MEQSGYFLEKSPGDGDLRLIFVVDVRRSGLRPLPVKSVAAPESFPPRDAGYPRRLAA